MLNRILQYNLNNNNDQLYFHVNKIIDIDKFKYIELISRHITYYIIQNASKNIKSFNKYDLIIRFIFINIIVYNIENCILYLLFKIFIN